MAARFIKKLLAGALVSAGTRTTKVDGRRRSRHQRVLIATSTGLYNHATVCDAAIGAALHARGADVDILLCDGAIPACQMSKLTRLDAANLANSGQRQLCEQCFALGTQAFKDLPVTLRHYSEWLSAEARSTAAAVAAETPFAEIPTFTWQGLSVGEHAYAGALRFFARADLAKEPFGEAVLRKYLNAALLTAAAVRNLLRAEKYDVIVTHHGIYVPQGIIVETARQEGVRVVCWNPAYRKHTFIFSHGDTYHHTMISEPSEAWEAVELSPTHQSDLLTYLQSRRSGSDDWISFHDRPRENIDAVLAELGLNRAKPYVALLTSVVWDAQLHYRSNAFPNMLSWIFETIDYFALRPELQLVIRVHPAEVRGAIPSRQKVADEIAEGYPRLPPNVFIVGPDHQASTYALSENANAVLIYNTKAGAEMASLGCTVIVAGEAWIRGKGFTLDASNPGEYRALLDQLPVAKGLTQEQQARAMRYAYHFFFRRMIPLPFIQAVSRYRYVAQFTTPDDLAPGRFPGLDIVCDGILNQTPFTYVAEGEYLAQRERAP